MSAFIPLLCFTNTKSKKTPLLCQVRLETNFTSILNVFFHILLSETMSNAFQNSENTGTSLHLHLCFIIQVLIDQKAPTICRNRFVFLCTLNKSYFLAKFSAQSWEIHQPLLLCEAFINGDPKRINQYFLLQFFAWLPWFKATVLNPLKRNHFIFDSANNIRNLTSPIMILHAEDDHIVPVKFGRKVK